MLDYKLLTLAIPIIYIEEIISNLVSINKN